LLQNILDVESQHTISQQRTPRCQTLAPTQAGLPLPGPTYDSIGTSLTPQERRAPPFGKHYRLVDRLEANGPRNSHQLVTLFAGQNEEAKSFLIHKDFACHYSPVLKAALNSSFIEGQTQSYRMEEDNHEAVHLLIHCKC
jgi:hypothetical protein